MIVVGVDIGAVSTETVILGKDKEILGYDISRTGSNSKLSAQRSVDNAISKAGIRFNSISYIVSTGYGRKIVPFESKEISEISCHARGAHYLFPDTRTILDIGGQDCKAIKVNHKGEMVDFVMNDKCAAGTGRFLQVMADTLEVEIVELGELSLKADIELSISSMCTVFAESEVVSLIAEGQKKENIIKGLHKAISDRIVSLARKIKIEDAVTLTGGVINNMGVVRSIGLKLDNIKVNIPEQPEIVGAFGAALFAYGFAK